MLMIPDFLTFFEGSKTTELYDVGKVGELLGMCLGSTYGLVVFLSKEVATSYR